MGNICRSPIAEVVFRREAEAAGIKAYVDSAGIIDIHKGKLPERRARETMKEHGILMQHRARQITKSDFVTFDFILGKDEDNMYDLDEMKQKSECKANVELFGKYHPKNPGLIIRDPYYDDDAEGFEVCYQQCVECSKGLIEHLKSLQ